MFDLPARLRTSFYQLIARRINAFAKYYDNLYLHAVAANSAEPLFGFLKNPHKQIIQDLTDFPNHDGKGFNRSVLVLNGTLNNSLDIQTLLRNIKTPMSRHCRIACILYNPYLRWVYNLASKLGWQRGPSILSFITRTDLENLAKLSGFEIVNSQTVACFPINIPWLGRFIDAVIRMVPGLRMLSLAMITVLRPIIQDEQPPSLSVLIPARNEKGNIENAITRMPEFPGVDLEIIFVEGHSQDNTWEEILRVQKKYGAVRNIQAFRQTGKGKGDAVRLGFSKANGDLLTILDADLTMPPEKLSVFYDAYRMGVADFVNGSRLVYPMEGKAMRFLNRLGNIFFAKALSYVLDTRFGDTLCGTKLVTRHDYTKMTAWRQDFGDFDPFGDFELLFPAAILQLGIVDIPIRYLDRTYGSTNISRFRHGFMLFKMTMTGLFRLKLGLFETKAQKR